MNQVVLFNFVIMFILSLCAYSKTYLLYGTCQSIALLSVYLFFLFIKFSYIFVQSVTPHLSLGGEVFWAGVPRKSGIGYAARYETDKMVMILLSWFIRQLVLFTYRIKNFSL